MAGQQADGGTGKDGSVEDAAYFDYGGIVDAAMRLATLMRRYCPTPDKPDAFPTPWSAAEAQLAVGQALMWLGVQLDPHESVRRAWPDHIWDAHPVDGDPFRGPLLELWELHNKHLCPALQDPPYAALPTIDPRLVDKLETAANDLAKIVDELKPARPAWATELQADAAQAGAGGSGAVDGPQTTDGAPHQSGPRHKRSTVRGEARLKLIAALTEHHKYQNGSCLIWEPIRSNELARKADVAYGSANNFFNWAFRPKKARKDASGHEIYKAYCLRDKESLVRTLKAINDEFLPPELAGAQLPEDTPE